MPMPANATVTATAARRARACAMLDRLAAAAPVEDGGPGRPVAVEGDAAEGYLVGVLDMLAMLGAVRLSDDGRTARVVSPQGGWALRILSDIIDYGEPLVADWHTPGRTAAGEQRHPFGRATDLLAALDRRRYELLPGAAPVREVRAVVGVIPRRDPATGAVQFLLEFDEAAGAWQLPGGRPEPGDQGPRDTLRRELGEELGVAPAQLDALDLADLVPLMVRIRESPTYGPRSRANFTLFLVRGAQGLAADGARLRWLAEAEVRAGSTADGQPVSAEPLAQILGRTGFELAALGV